MTRRELAALLVLWGVISTAVATGIVVGALVVFAAMPDAVSASRSAQQPERSFSPLPTAGRTEAPTSTTAPPSPSPTGTRPAATAKPRTATPPGHSVAGTATWFRSPAGVSAAGPALRAAVGPGWRGTRVTVCAGGRCVATVLGDWCACGVGNRVIDLHAPLFAQLAPLSRGVLEVTVKW